MFENTKMYFCSDTLKIDEKWFSQRFYMNISFIIHDFIVKHEIPGVQVLGHRNFRAGTEIIGPLCLVGTEHKLLSSSLLFGTLYGHVCRVVSHFFSLSELKALSALNFLSDSPISATKLCWQMNKLVITLFNQCNQLEFIPESDPNRLIIQIVHYASWKL